MYTFRYQYDASKTSINSKKPRAPSLIQSNRKCLENPMFKGTYEKIVLRCISGSKDGKKIVI